MERALFTHNEENKKVLFPSIDSNMDELLSAINMQKHQNAMLQKQLTDLQKEKQQMQQQILAFHSRIELLEEQVGVQ
jgi:septal ring factor EnvC (AmiA/AmiB activator)